MDSFYASVEMLKMNLKFDTDIPIAVGGDSMLCTSNYAARKYGVRSAMPGFIAKKLCPNLKIVPTDFKSYRLKSDLAKAIFEQYSPVVVMMSLDEASLDITDHVKTRSGTNFVCLFCAGVTQETDLENCRLCKFGKVNYEKSFGTSLQDCIEEIRYRVEINTQGCTCSAGISVNSFLAKCISDQAKPNGSKILLTETEISDMMKNLPIGRCFGVGPVQEKFLKDVFSIEKCGDITDNPSIGRQLCVSVNGSDSSQYISIATGCHGSTDIFELVPEKRKSLSQETTFSPLVISDPEIFTMIKKLTYEVSNLLVREKLRAKTITFKFKTDKFDTFTRQKRVDLLTNDYHVFLSYVEPLYRLEMAKNPEAKLRLIGIRASDLEEINAEASSSKSKAKSGILKRISSEVQEIETKSPKKTYSEEMDGSILILETQPRKRLNSGTKKVESGAIFDFLKARQEKRKRKEEIKEHLQKFDVLVGLGVVMQW